MTAISATSGTQQPTATGHASPGASVTIAGLTKRFKLRRGETFTALEDLRMDIVAGEFLAIVGPSGCGKSTLLRILAGLEPPSAGTVQIGGASPRDLSSRHDLGVAFQDHALLPWLTVRQNVALPFRFANRRIDDAKVDELIDLVGLAAFTNARPKQ
jgi:NitT/TauT family transport system ATP-binding protein